MCCRLDAQACVLYLPYVAHDRDRQREKEPAMLALSNSHSLLVQITLNQLLLLPR